MWSTSGSITTTLKSNSGNVASIGLACVSVHGTSGIDVAGGHAAPSSGTMTSGNFTTTGSDVILGFFVDRAQQNGMTTTGTGFAQLGQSSPKWSSMQSFNLSKTAGTNAVTGTETGGSTSTWVAIGIGLLPPSPGGTIATVGSANCLNLATQNSGGKAVRACNLASASGSVTGSDRRGTYEHLRHAGVYPTNQVISSQSNSTGVTSMTAGTASFRTSSLTSGTHSIRRCTAVTRTTAQVRRHPWCRR
jgi:hypothetical protein